MAKAERAQPLRERRRLEAKRAIQAAALDLFDATSFGAVTMEQIAEAARVGVATVYRHFGTKERVVMWDEYDPLLLENIAEAREKNVTLDGVRAAIRESLQSVYAGDARRILRRARLVARSESLQIAVLHELAALRASLIDVLGAPGSGMSVLDAEVAAGAVVACLQAAIASWVRAKGRPRLGDLIDQAFAALYTLSPPPQARRRERQRMQPQRRRSSP